MRLLLDTHILLWALSDDPRLSPEARSLLLTPSAELVVSTVSLWEIALKRGLRPDRMPVGADQVLGWVREAGYSLLALLPEHTVRVQNLPPHHGDPFDRMLVAQALVEPLRLVTHDRSLQAYSEALVLAV